MKLQSLSIIFIVIMLPIILIVSYYLNLQKSTLSMQTLYDQKIVESTKEAMEAYEINTTEWNDIYSNLSDSKRRSVMASVNTFITSISGHFGISGAAKENILSYIPAIAFTLYDGYYVYAPNYTPVVATYTQEEANEARTAGNEELADTIEKKIGQAKYDDEGNLLYENKNITSAPTADIENAKTEYKHTLTTYLPYSKKYEGTNYNVVIDYNLDNYIKVYGTVGSEVVAKEGNLVCFATGSSVEVEDTSPKIEYREKEITPEITPEIKEITSEILKEQILIDKDDDGDGKKDSGTYQYIYDIQNEKYYYDEDNSKFFRLVNGEKVYLPEASVGEFSAKYRKVVISLADTKIDVYQLLNGTSGEEWYVDKDNNGTLDERITDTSDSTIEFSNGSEIEGKKIYKKVSSIERYEDCSAINYYVDAYYFTNWVRSIQIKVDGVEILNISDANNPEEETSLFSSERREVIKNNVQKTLDISITQYAKIAGEDGIKPITISETDWDQIIRNASMISFFQGLPIGLKYYNNYAVTVSTTNNEFVNKDEIYFIDEDSNYHSAYAVNAIEPEDINCVNDLEEEDKIIGYKNTDYIRKTTDFGGSSEDSYHYYLHENLRCYHCLVGSNNVQAKVNSNFEQPYYTALARERYAQNKNVQYVNGELKDNLDIWLIHYNRNRWTRKR